jgi:hypothetical protein
MVVLDGHAVGMGVGFEGMFGLDGSFLGHSRFL